MMKATELRAKSVDELNAELIEMRRAQFSMRMQLATQQLNKVDQIRKVRRDVARVRTVLAEKSKSSAKAA
jgi:large subunit ribosomal protein L29